MLHSHSDLIAEARRPKAIKKAEMNTWIQRLADALEVAEKRATKAEAERDGIAKDRADQVRRKRETARHLKAAREDLAVALAVIEKAKAHEWSCWGDSDTHRILSSASADVLRERDAKKWDEGAQWAAVELGAIDNERQAWITPTDNPYRRTEEESNV